MLKTEWKEYYERLHNEEYLRKAVDNILEDKGLIVLVSEEEVKAALKATKKKKAVGPDEVPVERTF